MVSKFWGVKNKFVKLFLFIVNFAKLAVAWIVLHTTRRELLKKDIWLIREKRDEARDNGYHFYKYLRENYPEINAFYVITRNSEDRHKIEQYGNLISADSLEHCIYFLAAKFSINSQQYGAYPFHFGVKELNIIQNLCNPKQKVVFLQHGITKSKFRQEEFSYNSCNIDFFVTSAKREYDFIKETYNYPDHAIGCVGMPRLDYLHEAHVVENKILVMPTWRKWLSGLEQTNFSNSEYFSSYIRLLSDQSLVEHLRKSGYTIVFYMHYMLQPYTAMFKKCENDVIFIADRTKYDVQQLLMSSKLMITDYSSVFFDFAYMDKPVIYYQFDKKKFREQHYADGYFSYEDDGFGPCFENYDDMKQYLVDMVDAQCVQPEKYDLRVKSFFDLRDNRNCERTFESIKALEEYKK